MTTQDVVRMFLLNDELDQIRISEYAYVSAHKFAELFASAPTEPSYQDLMDVDGGVMGYAQFLESCKNKGILK